MKRVWFVCVALGSSLGCARRVATPCAELLEARSAVGRAEASSTVSFAEEALQHSRADLARAERAQLADPGSEAARELAIEAVRRAEIARVEGMLESDRRALDLARRRVDRLRGLIDRRAVEQRLEAEQSAEHERLRLERRGERARSLEALIHAYGSRWKLSAADDGFTIEVPVFDLFLYARPLLIPRGAPRLARIAAAVAGGPASSVHVDVTCADEGTEDARGLAKRRATRIREALVAQGVDAAAIDVAFERGKVSRVTIAAVERPLVRAPYVPPGVLGSP